MRHIRIFIVAGVLFVSLIVVALCVFSAIAPKSTIWYKDIATTYSAGGVGNAFDYTELKAQIPQIEPKNRAEILALSENQINSMTTLELLVTCLDYPLFGDIFFYEDFTVGFDSVVSRYNGLQALLERDDVGEVLVEFYNNVRLEQVIKTDEYGHLRLKYLELILSSDEVLMSIDSDTRRELFNTCAKNYTEICEKYAEELTPFAVAQIAGKILYIDSVEFRELADNNEVVIAFLNHLKIGDYSEETWSQILQCVEEYMK